MKKGETGMETGKREGGEREGHERETLRARESGREVQKEPHFCVPLDQEICFQVPIEEYLQYLERAYIKL